MSVSEWKRRVERKYVSYALHIFPSSAVFERGNQHPCNNKRCQKYVFV